MPSPCWSCCLLPAVVHCSFAGSDVGTLLQPQFGKFSHLGGGVDDLVWGFLRSLGSREFPIP